MFFCKGTWKNTLYVHFKCILLHSRIFAVLVHWEISKKNGNWKQNVPNSCTVHRVFMILKSILISFSIQTISLRKTWWSTGFVADHSRRRPGFDSSEEHRSFLLFVLILLNKVMENKSFFLNFLSRYKDRDATTKHRYDHKTMPNCVLLGTLKKKLKLISTEGWYTY